MRFIKKLSKILIRSKQHGSRNRRELFLLSLGLVFVLTLGTVGYVVIEDWTAFDALYMTIITLSTVGFQEIHPLSNEGRAFTILMIMLGVGLVMALLSTLARVIVDEQFSWIFERGGMEQTIKKLKDHTIFCGYGRLGKIAVERFAESNQAVVVVDLSSDRIDDAVKAGHIAFEGDATLEEVLVRAGVERAKRLVSLLPTDPDNLYVILSSKELNPDLYVITRSEEEAGEQRLTRAGADRVLSPYRLGGLKIAEALLRPHVMQFLDIASDTGIDLEIEEIKIPEDSPVIGISLQDAELRNKTNVNIAAIINSSGTMTFAPEGTTILQADDALIGLGSRANLEKLEQLLVGPDAN